VLVALLWPNLHLPDGSFPLDKLAHFLLFMGWTAAVIHDSNVKWWKALCVAMAFALITELIQIPIEKRTFDVNDLLADLAGILFGIANSATLIRIVNWVLRR